MFLDHERRLRLPWRLLIYLAGLAGIQIAGGIGVAVVLVIYLMARDAPVHLNVFDDWMLPLTILAAPVVTIAAVALTLICRRYLDGRSMASLGLVYPIPRPLATLGGGTAAGGVPILLATAILIGIGALGLNGLGGGWLALPLLPTLVLMAFFEEITFRGYMLQNFVEAGWTKRGLAVTSVLFWLAHSLNPNSWTTPINSLNLFGAGMALGLAYLVSRNLWLPTAVHFGWNATQGVLLDIPISGIETPGLILIERDPDWPEWMTGGSFGLEGSVVTLAVLAVLIVVLGEIYRRQPLDAEPPAAIFLADAVPDAANAVSLESENPYRSW
jgi:membrane protease YdiL (CAAX protease family)